MLHCTVEALFVSEMVTVLMCVLFFCCYTTVSGPASHTGKHRLTRLGRRISGSRGDHKPRVAKILLRSPHRPRSTSPASIAMLSLPGGARGYVEDDDQKKDSKWRWPIRRKNNRGGFHSMTLTVTLSPTLVLYRGHRTVLCCCVVYLKGSVAWVLHLFGEIDVAPMVSVHLCQWLR